MIIPALKAMRLSLNSDRLKIFVSELSLLQLKAALQKSVKL